MADEKEKKEDEIGGWELLNSPIFLLLLGAALILGLYHLTSPYQECVQLIQGPGYNKPLHGAKEICLGWTNW